MIGRPLRAVVVDDCDDMRGIVRILLTRAGYEIVGEAGDGAVGVHATRLTAPDVVVLDLDMPVLDGYAALPLLRKAAPDARLVVFSHDVTYESAERLRDLGAHGWVRKGSSLALVLAVVNSTLFAAGRGPVPTETATAGRSGIAQTPRPSLAASGSRGGWHAPQCPVNPGVRALTLTS